MKNFVLKRVPVRQYRAQIETDENGWNEYIAVYDEDGKEVARSGSNHPEGYKSFHWNGFDFIMPHGYKGKEKAACYVKVTDKIFFEHSDENS